MNINTDSYWSRYSIDDVLVPIYRMCKKITLDIKHLNFEYDFNIKNKSLFDVPFSEIIMSLKKVLFMHEIPAQALPMPCFN
jgi:hypothetical protein